MEPDSLRPLQGYSHHDEQILFSLQCKLFKLGSKVQPLRALCQIDDWVLHHTSGRPYKVLRYFLLHFCHEDSLHDGLQLMLPCIPYRRANPILLLQLLWVPHRENPLTSYGGDQAKGSYAKLQVNIHSAKDLHNTQPQSEDATLQSEQGPALPPVLPSDSSSTVFHACNKCLFSACMPPFLIQFTVLI